MDESFARHNASSHLPSSLFSGIVMDPSGVDIQTVEPISDGQKSSWSSKGPLSSFKRFREVRTWLERKKRANLHISPPVALDAVKSSDVILTHEVKFGLLSFTAGLCETELRKQTVYSSEENCGKIF